ncbi:hypothetical protein D1610_11485 [Sphingomonas gilva]|uniref:ParB-like N-terminal domain-containing protein n=1 Tax=Sphingomonas gilva TaxID=2305907 RepID=A0A396RLE5_9SPHN|nr:ParB N-terminal domain-containing protein [Sphingomonas gilva]RHW17164.1 hypothetical protein D1610_11485 [Sphingomonas gilva]
MPTAPDLTNLEADTLQDFVLVRTDQVDRGDRMRDIDPVWAEALGQVMLREGQRTPIEICRLPGATRWTLVTGGHRHAGAELVDIQYLRAEIVSANRDDRRMREVSENLWRRDLDPLDRAAFVAEAVAIHKRRAGIDPQADGRAVSAAVRWQKSLKADAQDANVTMTVAYGLTDEVAAELGFSPSTVERSLLLHRRLLPSLVARLRDERHPILSNASQLRALAKLDAGEQEKVVDKLLFSGAPAKSVSDALARVRGSNRAVDPEAKRLSAFIGSFQRMGLSEKKGALFQLRGLMPAGHRLIDESHESRPDDRYRIEMVEAMEAAFDLLLRLQGDGEPVEDEEIAAAKGKLQMALMVANTGAVPMPGAAA